MQCIICVYFTVKLKRCVRSKKITVFPLQIQPSELAYFVHLCEEETGEKAVFSEYLYMVPFRDPWS